ncbi:unnamed protein product [Polarella glacialis]|uniref:Uncharacterized protein n=1 Tax=Polarella glacialis TaxID=89957 RepID=A0A813JKA8_POLGL|nr:unnamed protein product [Polarella glacialis]|mmetsp:Transcript_77730/g.140251  ORF Transcript_77730/g.140251 Transcript_77730/m.140251 type:complete len:110 (+) Transcript_77730:301-630(+)
MGLSTIPLVSLSVAVVLVFVASFAADVAVLLDCRFSLRFSVARRGCRFAGPQLRLFHAPLSSDSSNLSKALSVAAMHSEEVPGMGPTKAEGSATFSRVEVLSAKYLRSY